MNVLFIGGFFPKKMLSTISKDTYGKVGFSNHNFEMSLINGLSKQPDVHLRLLSAPKAYAYPHNNRNLWIKSEKYNERGIHVASIGYFNLTLINRVCKTFQLFRGILHELNQFKGNKVNVIVNTPTLEYSVALLLAKKCTSKQLQTMMIIPDVPECLVEMSNSKSLKNWVLSISNKINRNLSRRYDKYVFLTDAMNSYYGVSKCHYIIVEGLIDEDKTKDSFRPDVTQEKEIILYTGTLRKIFGILDLVEVFEKGNFPNTELWICGSGETSEYLRQKSEENKKIKFLGSVTPIEALELQSKATILANPRTSKGNYTKFSFPSKTIEYLLAGKSMIANKLSGIPNEYDPYIFYPKDESVESWITKINEIIQMNKDARFEKSSKGREFILSKKTAKAQCERIINLLKK